MSTFTYANKVSSFQDGAKDTKTPGLYNKGTKLKKEKLSVSERSLLGSNFTATFPLTASQHLVCNYGKHKPLYSPHTKAKFVFGTDWRRQAASSDTYHCLLAPGDVMFTTTHLRSTRQEMSPSHHFPTASVFLLNKHALPHVMTLSQQQEHIQGPSQKPLTCTLSVLGHTLHWLLHGDCLRGLCVSVHYAD